MIEGAVIVFGLVLGYWLVTQLFFRAPTAVPPAPEPPTPPSKPQWHDILGLSPMASTVEIRDSYKRLMSKYHPDKVESLGQELKDLASHKSQEITVAYREAMRARGMTA